MPKRIQMSRQRPWRAEHPDAVIIDRSTKWGNPLPVAKFGRELAVEGFRAALTEGRLVLFTVNDVRAELAGKDLACWCRPEDPCHGDVLLRIANPEPLQCPECRDGKHSNCTGWTLDADDNETDCTCRCKSESDPTEDPHYWTDGPG